jgi:hypothetical protein
VSLDLAKLAWIPLGGVEPDAAAPQFLHLVQTVFEEAVQALAV